MLSLPKLKIAVTGGSGFLGSHLLPLLVAENCEISCLIRAAAKADRLPPKVEAVRGDCLDADSLLPLLRGRDVIIHMAGLLFAPDWQSYLEANVRATRNLLAARASLAPEERPSKLIFIPSLAAAGPCASSPGIAENTPGLPVSGYGWSKLISEKLLQEDLGEDALILRPPIIYGSGDKGLLPMFKSAAHGLGISPGIGRDFPVSVIHARDVSRAILLLLRNDASGIYHLNDGEEHSMASFCQAMGKAMNRKLKILRLPLPLMGSTAALCSAWANLGRQLSRHFGLRNFGTPQWNLDKFREARQEGWLANAERIRSGYGFKASMNLEQGMREAVTGYHKAGLL